MEIDQRSGSGMVPKIVAEQLNRVQPYLLLATVVSIPLSVELNRIITTATAIITVFAVDWSEFGSKLRTNWRVMLPLVVGLVNVFGLLYTNNMKDGMAMLERSAFYGVLPFLILLRPPDRLETERLLNFFTLSCLAVCFYCLYIALGKVIETGSIVNQDKILDRQYFHFLNNELTLPAGISPIYLGLFVNLAIAFMLLRFFVWKERTTYVVVMLVMLHFFQMLLFALSAILGLFLMWCIIILHLMKSLIMARRLAILTTFCTLIVLCVALTSQVRPLREKVVGKLSYNIEMPFIGDWTGVTIRLAIWQCAWDAVKESPFYGNGTGDARDKLSEAYARNKFLLGVAQSFNSHNQYIESYLMQGVFGLLVLLIVHAVPLFGKMNAKNWIMSLFILLMLMGYMTEAILSVQKGVVFFSFFFPVLYLYPARPQ
ncbi:MAG: O-antigen ligase family protein [Chryseolinea sp.]